MNQRQQFPLTMERLMEADDKIVVLLGDIGVHSFRRVFERWPDRCFNMGVCEQASVGFAAGLAKEGYYPIYHTIDSFLVRRAYEFIRLDFGEMGLKGLFVTVGHDNDYAAMGASHKCPEGRWMMRKVPNMYVWEPIDAADADHVLSLAHKENVLAYVRLSEQKA